MDCTRADRSFGPRISPSCRSFDFTLFFEDVFFACLPAGLFILLSACRVGTLLRSRRSGPLAVSLRSRLLGCKLITLTSLLAVQLAFLAIRAQNQNHATKTSASVAAEALSSIATVSGLGLVLLDRQRASRPSTILTLYLSAAVILSIARVRTIWLISGPSTAVSALVLVVFLLTVVALLLESVERRADLLQVASGNQAQATGPCAPEEVSGLWIRTFFTWLASTFRLGYSRVISADDLPPLDSKLHSATLGRELRSKWDDGGQKGPGRYRLLRACFNAYFFSLTSPIIPRLCLTAFTFSQPLLIGTTVTFVAQADPDANYGKGLIAAWALVSLGIAASSSIYHYQNIRFTTRLRGGLISLVYWRTLEMRTADAGEITAITLLGADVERVKGGMGALHEVWASLLDIAIASWLLGQQLSLACLAPIVLVLVFVAATSKISMLSRTSQMKWIEGVQARLRITTDALSNMKSIKMYGLGQLMCSIIQATRIDEIHMSAAFRRLLVATLSLSLTPINLAPVVTFGIYVVISVFWKDGTLLPAQAFTSVVLISLLTTPVVVFIQVLPQVIQCLACFDRIQEFCSYGTDHPGPESGAPEHTSKVNVSPRAHGASSHLGLEKVDGALPLLPQTTTLGLRIVGECFTWAVGGRPVLTDLDIEFPVGTISVVVGPVGSGKSSLLRALLGEMISPTGTVSRVGTTQRGANGGVQFAYCSQEPWLENTSIRQNIVGSLPIDDAWYKTTLSLCGLDSDVAQLPRKDNPRVGSQGLGLSGGQKHRVALARAIYSKQKVVVLDDVFSGMDARTADSVSLRLLGPQGILRDSHTTVVMASHNRKVIALANRVIVVKDGRIAEVTRPAALLQDGSNAEKFGVPLDSDSTGGSSEEVIPEAQDKDKPEHASRDPHETRDDGEPEIRPLDENRKKADFTLYKYYMKNAGYADVALYAVAVVVWIFCTEFSTIWINWWSEANTTQANQSVGFYMGIYAMLGVMGTIAATSAAWFAFTSVISSTAANFHSQLLRVTFSAPLRFFTETDSGELLNRFSQDMELIDMELPVTMVNYTSTLVSILAKVVVLAIFSRYLGAAIPLLGGAVYLLQRFYLQTSRQVRLLDIEAKAPLYAHFAETVAGAATIRAFGRRADHAARCHRHVDASQRPMYLQHCTQAWLALALSVLVAALSVLLVAVVVVWHDRFSAGSIGVSLAVVIGFSETLARLIEVWTKLESSVGAVRRVKQFAAETPGECAGDKNAEAPRGWPAQGGIEFEGVSASYRPDDQPVLRNISLSILPGQHVAVCGRSGSGKTSLILALLRMIDINQGNISIDSVNLADLRRDDVRHAINLVPQDPLLIPGTVRANVDPVGAVPDDAVIVSALARAGLRSLVDGLGGLDARLDPAALSAGQKQLLCFARALVRKAKILVLDEAMSSVDSETESAMQDMIDTEFRDCTVIGVMHRLRHVARYDKVALMEDGSLLEFDRPDVLLAKKTRFSELYRLHAV